MGQKVKPSTEDKKTERLRALRLAQEAARREAGIWGDMAVGEIVHDASHSAVVQVWKGQRRPDPFEGRRTAGMPADEWLALLAWVNARKAIGFQQRIVAWDLSADEAKRVARTRVAELQAQGYTVLNPAARPQ
jgi:hypothetical protein